MKATVTITDPASTSGRGAWRLAGAVLMVANLLVSAPGAHAEGNPVDDELRLIELYTSHGCSSCPSADLLLGELLAEDDQLLALEFHVDYWNNLVHGGDGNFVDPYSDAAFSKRQREYNAASLAGRPGVYTPQAIINGRFATVGSNRRHIAKALAKPVAQALSIVIAPHAGSTQLKVSVAGHAEKRNELASTDILLARYLDKATTRITGGENRHKSLTNHHIVTQFTVLGEVSAQGDMVYTIDAPAPDEGCVILVQENALSPVYAAAPCP